MVFFAYMFCGFSNATRLPFGATKSRYNWQNFIRAARYFVATKSV